MVVSISKYSLLIISSRIKFWLFIGYYLFIYLFIYLLAYIFIINIKSVIYDWMNPRNISKYELLKFGNNGIYYVGDVNA
jgi:hypothetical protein